MKSPGCWQSLSTLPWVCSAVWTLIPYQAHGVCRAGARRLIYPARGKELYPAGFLPKNVCFRSTLPKYISKEINNLFMPSWSERLRRVTSEIFALDICVDINLFSGCVLFFFFSLPSWLRSPQMLYNCGIKHLTILQIMYKNEDIQIFGVRSHRFQCLKNRLSVLISRKGQVNSISPKEIKEW